MDSAIPKRWRFFHEEDGSAAPAVTAPEILVCPGAYDCFSFEELSTLMGFPQIRELEGRFLTADILENKYGRSR